MAIKFDGTVNDYINLASGFGFSTRPITLACWFKRDATGTDDFVVSVTEESSGDRATLWMDATGLKVEFFNVSPSYYAAATKATNDTSWHALATNFPTANTRDARVDGSAGTADTTIVSTDPAATNVFIGALNSSSPTYNSTGTVCAVAGWTVDLNGFEIISLARGFPPRRVRPQKLAFYMPLVRDKIEYRTGLTPTTANGLAADHPRIYGY